MLHVSDVQGRTAGFGMASMNKAGAVNKVFFTRRAWKLQQLYWFKKQTKNTIVSLRPVQVFVCSLRMGVGVFVLFLF